MYSCSGTGLSLTGTLALASVLASLLYLLFSLAPFLLLFRHCNQVGGFPSGNGWRKRNAIETQHIELLRRGRPGAPGRMTIDQYPVFLICLQDTRLHFSVLLRPL